MSSLAGHAAYNSVQCSAPPSGVSCGYSGGIATYGFVAGFSGTVTNGVRQVQFRAQNASGLNEQTAIASITVDTVAPSVSASAVTSPNGGEVWGGTGRTITWNSSLVTDAVGIASVRLEYSTGAGLWNLLSNGTNAGSFAWDITSVESRNDYTIRLTAFDHVGNSASDVSNGTFIIDRAAPTVPGNTLTVPNGGIYKGGSTVSILWNSGTIVDGGGLATNPVKFEYSTNNGTNWTQIGANLSNSGSYQWTVPSVTATAGLVRITATDTANNSSTDVSDANFIIDSTNPVQTITYAGGGGNTPQSGRKINDTGLDITLGATDAYLDRAYYQFFNSSDGLYWNNASSGWLGIETWNALCTDGTSLGTDLACSNVSTSISPTVTNGKSYALIFKSVDEAGNSITSITHTYTGDLIVPNLAISTASGSYLANGLTLSGTSSDTGSTVSSVKVSIRKGAQYWDGSAWVAGSTSLLAQTSNSYANWTYAFNPPLADSDGQSYVATVTAYDNAYKVNNSASASIGLIKDATGPVIASDVFTFDTGVMYRGGNTLAITWNPAKITASGAGLANHPITLSYNFTGTIVTIASNLANSGSYNLALPMIDTSSAIIIIAAEDTVGNVSGSMATPSFTIDSLPPTIQSASTMDSDVDGRIDAVQVRMNESITDSSIVPSDFALSLGIGAPTGFLTGMSGDDDTFVLTFSNTGTPASAPTLGYTAGSLVDRADNHLATASGIVSTDGVEPRVQNAKMYDIDGNGKMDLVKVQFGENMQANTANLFTVNNAFAGMSVASVSRNATNSIFDVVLNESTDADTSVGAMTLDFANNGTYKDLAGNAAVNFGSQAIEDLAKPVRLGAVTTDANGNFKTDRIDVRFSESITGNSDGEFTLSGLAAGSAKGTSGIAGDTLRIAVSETSDDNDTSLTPVFSYSGTTLADGSGNGAANMSNIAVSDGIAPKLLSRSTRDFDGNGKIDALKLEFSENLGTNLSAITVDVAGYSLSGYTSVCGASTAGDAIVCATLTEKSVADTDAVPAARILANTTLADVSGNLVSTEVGATNATDEAGPVVVGARYDAGNAGVADDAIYMTFSENLDAASVSGTSTNDFVITGGGALSASSATAFAGGNSATVTLGAGATALTAGTSKISIATGGVADTLANVSPAEGANNRVTVTSSIVINEVMWSGTGSSAHQYVELKNIGTSDIDIGGWVLANAGGNGVDLALPSDTIAGGAIYLVAKSNAAGSILDVTPQFVSAILNLGSSQNNLVLKSGAVVYDTAKANPWPEGNANAPTSMERRNPAGDGTSAANWYEAKSSVGFDAGNAAARGTPGAENIFDAESPIIGSFAPGNGVLLPTSPNKIALSYSDNGGSLLDPASATLLLQKWNGSSFADVTATYVNSGSKTVTQTGASYPTNPLPFGKYRASFNVSDNGGNVAQQIIDFSVDQFSFTVSGNAIDVGRLSSESLEIGSSEVTVTIKTLGAGFALAHRKITTLTATGGVNQIQDFDGTNGFGFDFAETGSGNTVAYAGTVSSVNGGTVANYPSAIDPNGNRKTYVYKIKYGAKITALQAAGLYGGSNAFDLDLSYTQ
jgi:hypothetical protein